MPLLKPGQSPFDTTSYRCTAPVGCVEKVMQRATLAQLEWFLESQQRFPKFMFPSRLLSDLGPTPLFILEPP